jgi:riboflavin synthase
MEMGFSLATPAEYLTVLWETQGWPIFLPCSGGLSFSKLGKMLGFRQGESDMYTGIIQALCPVVEMNKQPGLKSFVVELPKNLLVGLQLGASVSIDGTCFTVTKIDGQNVSFDAMQETLEKTTIGTLEQGDHVNIERSAKMGDEIGGHPMSGHVSTMAEIVAVKDSENNKAMTFKVAPEWMRFIFSKGFVGLDGASLTVVDANKQEGTFDVWFIPETLKLTRFGSKQVGDKVNVEIDPQTQVIVETVERVMTERNA